MKPRILTFHPDNEVAERLAYRVEEAGDHYDFHIDRL
jgi:hypothetical protein